MPSLSTAETMRRKVPPPCGALRLDRPVAVGIVKTVHTAIFGAELASIGWLVVSGLVGRRDRTVGVAAGAVAIEAAVFVANDHVCPLTPLAERLGATRGGVSDIFLPEVIARTIPVWSSALLVLAALLHARSVHRSLVTNGGTNRRRSACVPCARRSTPATSNWVRIGRRRA